MKNIYLLLNTIALIAAILWYISSNYEYEPLITMITLIITLLGLLFISTKSKSLKIKGDENITIQKSKDSSAQVDGNKNTTLQ